MTSAARKVAALPLLCLLAGKQLAAQSVTFAQLSDPAVPGSSGKLTPSEWLDGQHALLWAMAEINRLVRSGKKLDFVVVTGGFGLYDAPASQERIRALDSALVPAIYVLRGPDDEQGAFREFVTQLRQALHGKEVRDISTEAVAVSNLQILGLNSASFGNDGGKLSQSHRQAQLEEMVRLRGLASGHRSLVFAPIPDLDDPSALKQGKLAAASWHLDSAVQGAWNSLLAQADILALFSGRLHSTTRSVYARDYSWALNQPAPIAALKTWVCPPLTLPSRATEPFLRGFQIATVTVDGKALVATNWFPPSAVVPDAGDKSDKLAEGNAYEKAEEYDKAATAFQQGLSSKDDWVRGQAEAGFGRTVKQAKARTWKATVPVQFWLRWWRDLSIGLTLVLLLWLAVRLEVSRRLLKAKAVRAVIGRPKIMITPPRKGNEGAPVDEFTVQLTLALEDIHSVLGPVSGSQLLPVVYSTVTAPGTGETLPELKISGVELKAILAWLAAARNLLRRRIEIQVWGTTGRTQAFAVQRFGWLEEAHWAAPPPGSSADVIEAAQQLAYSIIGQEYIR